MCAEKGKRNWVFSDGDLPPAGEKEPLGHEALMVTNMNEEAAKITIDIYFEDKDPIKGIEIIVPVERVKMFQIGYAYRRPTVPDTGRPIFISFT